MPRQCRAANTPLAEASPAWSPRCRTCPSPGKVGEDVNAWMGRRIDRKRVNARMSRKVEGKTGREDAMRN